MTHPSRADRCRHSGDTQNPAFRAEIRATQKLTFADGVEGRKYNPAAPWSGQNTTSNLPYCVVERGSLTYALPMEASPDGEFGFAIDCNASTMKFAGERIVLLPFQELLLLFVSFISRFGSLLVSK